MFHLRIELSIFFKIVKFVVEFVVVVYYVACNWDIW